MPDEFDSLRRFDSAPAEPSTIAMAAAEARLRRLVRAERTGKQRLRRLPRSALLAVVPFALAVAIAATFVATRPATPSAGVQCFSAPSTSSDAMVIAAERSPTRACATMWRRGQVGGAAHTVPSLVACDGGSGAVDVFPSTDAGLCARLGLAVLPKSYGAQAAQFSALEGDLVARFASVRCPQPRRAGEWVRTALRRHGFSGWTVRVGAGVDGSGFSRERPCASLAFDSQAWTVTLVPTTPRS